MWGSSAGCYLLSPLRPIGLTFTFLDLLVVIAVGLVENSVLATSAVMRALHGSECGTVQVASLPWMMVLWHLGKY